VPTLSVTREGKKKKRRGLKRLLTDPGDTLLVLFEIIGRLLGGTNPHVNGLTIPHVFPEFLSSFKSLMFDPQEACFLLVLVESQNISYVLNRMNPFNESQFENISIMSILSSSGLILFIHVPLSNLTVNQTVKPYSHNDRKNTNHDGRRQLNIDKTQQ